MRNKNAVFKKISDEVKTICNFHCKCHQDDRISNIFQFLDFALRNIFNVSPQEKENVIES